MSNEFKSELTIIFCIILIITSVFTFQQCDPVHAEATNSMTLHAIYLGAPKGVSDEDGGDVGGDAVLLESQGEFLLMDTGRDISYDDKLKPYLNRILGSDKASSKELSIYISHLHPDHFGAYEEVIRDFNVKTLYLPPADIAPELEDDSEKHAIYKARGNHPDFSIKLIAPSEYNGKENDKTLNKITTGNAKIDIMGPAPMSIKLNQFPNDKFGTNEGHYKNNFSLVSMITCGNTKYFTGGDIEDEAEEALIRKYGHSLKADIMKLSHHGSGPSNSENFLNYIRPTYSFFMNHGDTTLIPSPSGNGKLIRTSNGGRRKASAHGICVCVGDQQRDLVLNIENNRVSMYTSLNGNKTHLSGWVRLVGGDGKFSKQDVYYINPTNGRPLTGIQKMNGKTYYFGTGGRMEIGAYAVDGEYTGFRTAPHGRLYIKSNGEVYTGFKTVKGKMFYFDDYNGAIKQGTKSWGIFTIKGKKYAINENGVINRSGWKSYKSGKKKKKYRYFNKKTGVMKTGFFKDKKHLFYLDKKSGFRKTGTKKWKVYRIGKKKYAINQNGVIFTGGWKSYKVKKKTKYRYFNKKGVMLTGKKKVKGKKYKFNKKTGFTNRKR